MSVYLDISKNLLVFVCPPKGKSTKTIDQGEEKLGRKCRQH
jgi:hypothetical protein